MNSDTEIANAALIIVGAKTITDLTADTTTHGDVVRRWYQHSRDTLLRSYTWNFALRRSALSKDATGPDFEFTNSYSLPTNPYCLRALEMWNSFSEWKVEGRKLLTDDTSVNLKYISRVANVVDFDDMFTGALIYYIGANIAGPIKRDNALGLRLFEIAEVKAQDARTRDSQEGTFNVMRSRALTSVRSGIVSPPNIPVAGGGTAR